MIESLRHSLPRILLGIAPDWVIERLLERLRWPGAIERTRPDRHAGRRTGVRCWALFQCRREKWAWASP